MTVDDVARLLDLAGRGRTRPAIDLVEAMVADGSDPSGLVLGLLTTTQERVGDLWLADDWSVAQEHAAAAVVDGIVGALSTQPTPRTPLVGTLVVACAEEEYHTLPARMGAELLRRDGWDVTFLGASVPAADLQAYVAGEAVDAVIVSCTIGAFLIGAARSLAAVTELGLPALAAGTAFGSTPDRALALGASGWLDGSSPLAPAALCALPATAAPFVLSPGGTRLELRCDDLASRCRDGIARALGIVEPSPRWHRELKDDVVLALRYLGVAAELQEPALFEEHLDWRRGFLSARGLPAGLLEVFVSVLRSELDADGFHALTQVLDAEPVPAVRRRAG